MVQHTAEHVLTAADGDQMDCLATDTRELTGNLVATTARSECMMRPERNQLQSEADLAAHQQPVHYEQQARVATEHMRTAEPAGEQVSTVVEAAGLT